jgi:spermidine synthase
MHRPPEQRDFSFSSITAAGFAATIAQVLLLRELLVLFYGNEMSTALALAGWLLWTAVGSALAARASSRIPARESTLGLLLALLAAALPVLVLVLRGARPIFGIPSGELATIGMMVLVSLSAPALVCPLAGALFGLCWAFRRPDSADAPSTRPLGIYLGEALGAGLGGLAFFFVLVRIATALETAIVVALLLLGVSGWVLRPRRRGSSPAGPARLVWSLAAGAVLAVALLGGRLEELSRRWQWGEQLAGARDTPFHNVAILSQPDQVTVFANGLWLFTLPDPATAELAVHIALLQHPRPQRLLLLGGGLAGHLEEALKHPGIERIDYVEQDPELISFTQDYVSAGIRDSLRAPRVRVHREDAGRYLRRHVGGYDVILMSVGDPINAQMNRFYTVELFRRIRRLLRPGGIFSFSVPGGGDAIGPAHARLLGSVNRTLREAFPQVAVLPGERARFLATGPNGSLVLDPWALAERLRNTELDLVHVRADTLADALNPFRLEYVDAVLGEVDDSPVNRQFRPICYFHVLMLWAAQWHPSLERVLAAAVAVKPLHLSCGLAVAGVAAALFFWRGRLRYRQAVAASVLVQGASGMVLQVVLILGFQILEGFAYLQLALIIAFFMAGLAFAPLLITVTTSRWADASRAIGGLAVVQAGVTVFPLLLLVFFSPAGARLRDDLSSTATSWAFSAMSLAAGVLGGAHFSLAALAFTAAGGRLDRTGGYLYAVDLAGAAGGAVAAGLFVLPLYGVSSTLILLSGMSLVCLLAILRRPGMSGLAG